MPESSDKKTDKQIEKKFTEGYQPSQPANPEPPKGGSGVPPAAPKDKEKS